INRSALPLSIRIKITKKESTRTDALPTKGPKNFSYQRKYHPGSCSSLIGFSEVQPIYSSTLGDAGRGR
ncbi:MAG: hypothetical protein LUD68_02510, partial [Rikenellaceae bacterium]|nr:hypothetical protein [Rikenellaceae bacterium]